MTITLPSFRGVVKRLVLAVVGVFFVMLLLRATPLYPTLVGWFALWPVHVWRMPWQFVTYAFLSDSLLGVIFSLLSVWFIGGMMEDERGSRWVTEYFLVTTVGGAVLASLLALTPLLAGAAGGVTVGMWPFVLALVLAFARFHPEQEVTLYFVLRLKAKYMAAIFVLVYMALALGAGDRLGATVAVCAALCGYVYLRFVGRRGLTFVASERWYGMRNAYYKAKRRRAGKKFEVYMRGQGKDVRVPEEKESNDKRWMN